MEAKADDEQERIQQFMEIAGEPANLARQFLQATSWHLEEAIQLYFAGGSEAVGLAAAAAPAAAVPSTSAPDSSPPPDLAPAPVVRAPESPKDTIGENYVRPPLPVKREVLYEDIFQLRAHRMAQTPNQPTSVDAFRNFEDEANQRATWGAMEASNSASPGLGGMKDSLAALYRPPFDLMFQGTFEQAKSEAARQGKWLLVNLQSTKEFSSYTLNRDTWAHEAVKETVSMSFVFWQVYDDTEEGRKVCTYYKLNTMPTTLVLDPLTGQKMRAWEGMIMPDRLLEDLVPYLDRGPMEKQLPAIPPQKRPRESAKKLIEIPRDAEVEKAEMDEEEELRRALAASLEDASAPVSEGKDSTQEAKAEGSASACGAEEQRVSEATVPKLRTYPILPEEPAANNTAACRVAVRLPDGKRAQRRFLRSDPIQNLWSFCCSQVPEAAQGRSFRLSQAIPGGTPFNFNDVTSIHEAGLGNAMIAMTWD
ncbi:UBX domain-containing protein 7 [Marchantia polymorpha subsp. ruderalis]|uniref:UBX domain-containing protein n=2 Tax=Marchantia polymorpha TaxID=3197 RepID=A0AAF6BZA8_MARPO|nr:hypothetical protein MARPO_0009s0063 [Marchantia polymorpha]BBN17342.1 hypothetical protein Mp_7g13780 [Marchantia polymorpha subsp. ruderalis]|eukprot:PTQ46946.1 hypothetical protein MARPO_0009s0063 [Marchantia polymorpha]